MALLSSWGKRGCLRLVSLFLGCTILQLEPRRAIIGNGTTGSRVPQRKLTIFFYYRVITKLYHLVCTGHKKRNQTQFRLYWGLRGFILGCVIYLCYVGWFGCLFANFRCYANVVPELSKKLFLPLAITKHQKLWSSVDFFQISVTPHIVKYKYYRMSCCSTAYIVFIIYVLFCSNLNSGKPLGFNRSQWLAKYINVHSTTPF